ncbi:DedA family protein [Pararhodobacter sp.]|uniref:DedA family protein n=1 Tax=Pararhodobacter sp. TaxID=2127056 RepID=UPI002AFF499E|nr:DedA family protein [Pararhodobacter sp.]
MTDLLFELVTEWGATALAVVTFLSCLAVPVPSSMMMLAAGAFAASGDLALMPVAASALAGAILGDQAGYQLGRFGLAATEGWLRKSPARAGVLDRARASIQARGGSAVFLSRWLFSILGPYVNLLSGGMRLNWWTFTAAAITGEVIWVMVYVGLGYSAGSHLAEVTTLLGNVTGLATSLLVTLGLGYALWRRRRRQA